MHVTGGMRQHQAQEKTRYVLGGTSVAWATWLLLDRARIMSVDVCATEQLHS